MVCSLTAFESNCKDLKLMEKKKNIWGMKGSRDVFVSYFEESGSSEII